MKGYEMYEKGGQKVRVWPKDVEGMLSMGYTPCEDSVEAELPDEPDVDATVDATVEAD